jgi:hypothetical protein
MVHYSHLIITWGFYKVGYVLSRMTIHTYHYDVLHVKAPFVIPLCQGFMFWSFVLHCLHFPSSLFLHFHVCWSFAHFVTPCNVHSTLCDTTSYKHTTCMHHWHQAIFCCWFVFLFLTMFSFVFSTYKLFIFKFMFSSFSFSLSSCSYFVVFSFSISYFHNIWK